MAETTSPNEKTLKGASNDEEATPSVLDANEEEKKDEKQQYEVAVLPDYILQSRADSLPPIKNEQQAEEDVTNGNKKNKKKRPRDPKIADSAKICSSILKGIDCPYENACRFSHDMKEFLASRPPDLHVEHFSTCPIFAKFGHCQYGASCRFGECHMNMATGQQIVQSNDDAKSPEDEVTNTISGDLQIQLRKNKYPFVCQRHGKKKGGKLQQQEETKQEDETVLSPPSLEPLPSKTRKLIDFSNKVYIAPLTTVGNLPFRRIMKQFGADITCGEMAVATQLLEGKPSEWALLKRHKSEDVFGIQLAAGYPDIFTRTMEIIEPLVDCDFVDLNLGCPLELICNKGAGAKLMMRDKQLRDSLLGITNTLQKCGITIKMRTGWDEKRPFAHELVSKIHRWNIPGINAIMVHGRSRLQRYSRLANWQYVNDVVAGDQDATATHIPIVGNGDILSYNDYETKVLANPNLVPCAMLGRGALIKPWLPREIKERRSWGWDISSSERFDILKDFCRFGLEHWGTDQRGVNNCRRFLLEWLSFLHRYVPVGLLEQSHPARINQRPPRFMCGRDDLETLFMSDHPSDWIKISEMLLGPVPDDFRFEPKHKANSYG